MYTGYYRVHTTSRVVKLDFISLSLVGLDCQKICDRVQKLVDEYMKSGKVPDNSFLDIRISNVSSTIDPDRPKIGNTNIIES
tara:strand:- start:570 stop:815 length:246 start_codon:yes stop_codon:yes gene_type:complete